MFPSLHHCTHILQAAPAACFPGRQPCVQQGSASAPRAPGVQLRDVSGPCASGGGQARPPLRAATLRVSAAASRGHPRCPVQQLSCCRAASSAWFQAAFSALECHPNRSSRVLGWGPQALQQRRAAPAAAMGCVGCAAGGRRSWEQGQLPAVTEPSRGSLDTSSPSSCRVLLASVRWQLPPPRMRKQGRWRQVRRRSTGPGPGGELWVWELAGAVLWV